MGKSELLFEIKTKMEKEDFRKLSYITIFSNKQKTIPLIVLLAAVGSILYSMMQGKFEIAVFFTVWGIFIPVAFAAIALSVEYKNIKKVNAIRSGLTKQPKQLISFFEHYLVAEDENAKRSHKIKYENLFQVVESKNNYVVYASKNAASMIRKMDISPEIREDFRDFLKTKFGERYKKF